MRNRTLSILVVAFLAANSAFAAITGTVMTVDGQPIEGATVLTYAFEGTDAWYRRLVSTKPERTSLATTKSGANGRFSIESPKEAVAHIRIEAAGFGPETRRLEKDDDAGAIVLTRAPMKTGRVTAGGKAIGGATVVWGGPTDFITTTDAEGKYSAPDPSKWASRVNVIHPQYAVQTEWQRFGGSAKLNMDRVLTAPVAIRGRVMGADGKTPVAGAKIVVDQWPLAVSAEDGSFTVTNPPKDWDLLVAMTDSQSGSAARTDKELTVKLGKSASLSGSVRDSKTAVPVAGAIISLSYDQFGRGSSWSVMADAKGNYTFPSLLAGSYRIFAFRPDYSFQFVTTAVTAASKSVKNVVGTQVARVTGIVSDEEKKPIAGTRVSVSRGNPDFETMMAMQAMRGDSTTSTPDGRFSIRVSPDSDFTLTAVKKGLPPGRSSSLKLTPGERKAGLVITIPAGYPLSGRVTNRDGQPLSDVAVVATESSPASQGMIRRQIFANMVERDDDFVRTAGDGTFTIKLKEGRHDINFKREGYAAKTVRAHEVLPSSSKAVDVVLDPGAEVRGRVTRGGVGVEGVTVGLFSAETQASTQTGPDGSFILSDLSPGQGMLNVTKQDAFIQMNRPVTAPADDVVVEVPPGGRISGRVVDKETKRPVPTFNAGISTSRSGGGMVIMTPPMTRPFTSEDGTFVLENVPAGPANVVVIAPGYTQGRVTNLTVEEGELLENVEVQMDTGVRVVGKVTGPDGTALSGVNVRAEMMGGGRVMRAGGPPAMAVTDASGEYVIDAQEPGEKTFNFSKGGLAGGQKTVELKGKETRIDYQLSSGIRVTGVVVTEGGAPVAEASVTAGSAADTQGGMGRRSTRTDSNGSFTLEGLTPGRYTFYASKSAHGDARVTDHDIASGGAVRLVMKTGGTIIGRVSGLTEVELQNATVSATSASGNGAAAIDGSGNFRIEGAPTGTVRVIARTGPGMASARSSSAKSIQLEPGGSAQVDIEFSTGTTVRGRVTRNGRPVPNAMVSFFPRNAQSQTSSRVSADSGGQYEVSGLDDAEYNVQVMDIERSINYTATHQVRGSGTFDIDMKTVPLKGRVVDASTGEAIEEALIEVRRGSGSPADGMFSMRAAQSDASGNFSLDETPSGNYTVTAEKTGYANKTMDVIVTDSGATVEIKMVQTTGVALKVVDGRDGRALNPRVRVMDAQNRVVYDTPFTSSSRGGEPVNLPLSAGMYRAVVSATGYATRTVSVSSPAPVQTIAMTPGGTLSIRSGATQMRRARLLGSDGREYYRQGGMTSYFTIDPSPGTTIFEYIAPGTYTLQILGAGDRVETSTQVTVNEGQVTNTEI